jgi:hypothetical protein
MSQDPPEPSDGHAGRSHAPGAGGHIRDALAATLRCVACNDVIGFYEPLVHVVGGAPRETSRAARSVPSEGLAGPLWHRDCWLTR